MGRRRKHYDKIVGGGADASIPFDRTRTLLKHLGFEERISGSHHVFKRADIAERVVVQPTREGKCKPYQVAQMREVLVKYNLREEL